MPCSSAGSRASPCSTSRERPWIARARLGSRAAVPTWIEADVTADWALAPVDVWHDRAVFHFLVDHGERRRYDARFRRVG